MVHIEHINPESCPLMEFETIISALNFESKNIRIGINLIADNITRSTLSCSKHRSLGLFCGTSKSQIQEYFMDIDIAGFEFQKILLFQDCSIDPYIKRIVYSTTNGIEIIEFNNGKWLKLKL